MFKYLFAICLIMIACGTNCKSDYNEIETTYVPFRMGNNTWAGTRINIQGVDCIVVGAKTGGSQVSPSVSCNWK